VHFATVLGNFIHDSAYAMSLFPVTKQ